MSKRLSAMLASCAIFIFVLLLIIQASIRSVDVADGFDKLRKQPRNNSRIVIEGIDEPVKRPEGKYSDRIRIDPFSPTYRRKPGNPEPIRNA